MAIFDPPTLTPDADARRWSGDVTLNWAVLFLVLGVVYMGLWFISSPDGHLATDTGGKAATLEAMSVRGDWDPDIGYWFEEQDPTGQFHAFDHTLHSERGTWVNATTFTMLYAMKPLYDIGGPRLAVLLAVLGGFLCAMSAGALERRFDPSSEGKLSFLLVGLSSSVVVYTADMWEHTLGLAAIGYGAVKTIDAIEGRDPKSSALLAGLMFGLAATMRQEAMVYGFVAGLVLVVVVTRRKSVQSMVPPALAMIVGTIVPIALHTAVEIATLGAPFRLQRSATTAGSNSQSSDRLDAALTTTVNLANGRSAMWPLLGLLLVLVAAYVVFQSAKGQPVGLLGRVLLIVGMLAICLHATYYSPVSAMFVATPLALLGVLLGFAERAWFGLAIGFAPLPLVLMTQFTAGHMYVWGGRYLFGSVLILTVLGITLARRGNHTGLLAGFAAGSLLVTCYAVAWAEKRIDIIAEDRQTIASITEPDELVVWRSNQQSRELGTLAVSRPWLSAETQEHRKDLAEILLRENVDTFVYVVNKNHDDLDFPGYRYVEDRGTLDNMGQVVETWVREG